MKLKRWEWADCLLYVPGLGISLSAGRQCCRGVVPPSCMKDSGLCSQNVAKELVNHLASGYRRYENTRFCPSQRNCLRKYNSIVSLLSSLVNNSPYSGIPPGKFSASLGIHRYWRKHLPLDKISNHASNLVHPEAMSLAIGINIRQGVSIRLGPEVKPSLISNILEECSPLFRIVIKCTRVRWAKVIASFAEKP